MRCLLITLTALLVACTVATGETRRHPTLFFQAGQVPALREKIRTDPVAREAFDALVRSIPDDPAILLPPDGADIRNQWRRAIFHSGRLGTHAAFCYLMTGEPRYLAVARDTLLTYAEHFDTRVNFHAFDDKSYMRIYFTGALGLHAAWTYDMIYDDLTPAERKAIEDGLLRKIVRMVHDSRGENQSDGNAMRASDYEWRAGQWNGVVYCNSGIAAIGFVLGDEAIIAHAVDNWKTYLARDLLADGLWQEEDYHYGAFCMSAMVAIAEMAHQAGYAEDLWTIRVPSRPHDQWDSAYASTFPSEQDDGGYRTLKQYFDAVLDYQYPTLDAGNWGWQMNDASFRSGHYVSFYELACRRYDEPGYAWFLARMNRARSSRTIWGAIGPILHHQPLENAPPRPTASRWYGHGRWLALKSIEGSDYWGSDAIYAFMPYGPYRTKALQRLSVDLFAFGKVVAPRVAKTSRHQSADEAFYLYDDAWNNVKVDGQNISIRRGTIADSTLAFHAFTPEMKIVQARLRIERYVRPSIWENEIIDRREDQDYIISRTLGLTDTYLLDIARVRFVRPPAYRHSFEWIWHGAGELTFEGVRHDQTTHDAWSAVWRDDDGIGLRSTMLGSDTCLTVPLWCASPLTQYVKAARSDHDTAYVVVHEPFKGDPTIAAVDELLHDDGRVAVRIAAGAFTDIVVVRDDVDGATVVDADGVYLAVDGPYAYARLADEAITVRGDITTLRLRADDVQRVTVNGKMVPFTIDDGWVMVSTAAKTPSH